MLDYHINIIFHVLHRNCNIIIYHNLTISYDIWLCIIQCYMHYNYDYVRLLSLKKIRFESMVMSFVALRGWDSSDHLGADPYQIGRTKPSGTTSCICLSKDGWYGWLYPQVMAKYGKFEGNNDCQLQSTIQFGVLPPYFRTRKTSQGDTAGRCWEQRERAIKLSLPRHPGFQD